jgi:lipid-binding SYLF domain-containing protein
MNSLVLTRATASVAALSCAVALAACGSSSTSGEAQTTAGKVDPERAKALERLDQSAQLLDSFHDKIAANVAGRAQCVVAIPSMSKGGLVIGAAGGSGFASCKTSGGWSAPAPVSIGGGTFGAQIGFQETDVVALVMTPKGVQGLESGNFNVGADASATAGPVGTGRGASTSLDSNADLASYSRSKGLFAGAELNGTRIKLDTDTAKALYGPGQSMHSILGGRVPAPREPAAQSFMNAIHTGFGPA